VACCAWPWWAAAAPACNTRWTSRTSPQNRDILVESAGVKVVVDPKSALYVTGSELDYVDALTEGGFKVKNPNAATSCSCGESFSA